LTGKHILEFHFGLNNLNLSLTALCEQSNCMSLPGLLFLQLSNYDWYLKKHAFNFITLTVLSLRIHCFYLVTNLSNFLNSKKTTTSSVHNLLSEVDKDMNIFMCGKHFDFRCMITDEETDKQWYKNTKKKTVQ